MTPIFWKLNRDFWSYEKTLVSISYYFLYILEAIFSNTISLNEPGGQWHKGTSCCYASHKSVIWHEYYEISLHLFMDCDLHGGLLSTFSLKWIMWWKLEYYKSSVGTFSTLELYVLFVITNLIMNWFVGCIIQQW